MSILGTTCTGCLPQYVRFKLEGDLHSIVSHNLNFTNRDFELALRGGMHNRVEHGELGQS